MTPRPALSKADLSQFTGSECWHRHALVRHVLYTDGARYVAEQAGAYWLIDEIALAQAAQPQIAAEGFQLWKLTVEADQTGQLTCEDGNGGVIYTKRLEFTDFPVEGIRFYFTDNVILLPSEY